MKRQRIAVTIEIDLDPVPGAFSTKEDTSNRVFLMVQNAVPWYEPELTEVKVVDNE